MQISVKLMGLLKEKTPADGCLQLEADATIEQALVELDIPAGKAQAFTCLLYTSPSPRDGLLSRMPSSA